MRDHPAVEERLNRFLARSGLASRREADRLIREGLVTVNGAVVRDPGTRIRPGMDAVKVSGKRVGKPPPLVYVILNKPRGVVSTMHDPEGRPCVADLLRGIPGRPVPAGRLDFDAEGLLLCTNDGEMVNRLLHPRYHVRKVYHVKVKGVPDPEVLDRLASGVVLDGRRTLPAQAFFHKRGKRNMWLRIVLYEGRKHQVKRMLEACGVRVLKLARVAVGPLRLGDLPVGSWRRLWPDEVASLRAYVSDLDKQGGGLHNQKKKTTRGRAAR